MRDVIVFKAMEDIWVLNWRKDYAVRQGGTWVSVKQSLFLNF